MQALSGLASAPQSALYRGSLQSAYPVAMHSIAALLLAAPSLAAPASELNLHSEPAAIAMELHSEDDAGDRLAEIERINSIPGLT